MSTKNRGAGAAHPTIFGLGRSLVRFEGEGDPKPTGAGAVVTPPPVQTPPAAFAVFPDADTFNKRMEREAKRILKEQGIEDPAAVRTQLAEYTALKAAQEEERKKQMTEVDRMREERNTFEAGQNKAITRAEEAELRAHLYQVFAEKGIKNFDYAFWAVTNKLATLGDAEELDERLFLDEMLKDASHQAALGVAAAAAPTVTPARVPVTNTDPSKGPVAPPAGGTPPVPGDAFAKTRGDFAADLQNRLGFTPMS